MVQDILQGLWYVKRNYLGDGDQEKRVYSKDCFSVTLTLRSFSTITVRVLARLLVEIRGLVDR